MKRLSQVALATSLLAVSASVMAADAPDPQTFVKNAYQAGLAEIQEGQLALRKSQDPDIKGFAQRMIEDHRAMNEQVAAVAHKEGITLPSEPDVKEKAELTALKALSGSAFDKMYAKGNVHDHEEVVDQFKSEASSGRDPAVDEVARKALPTLEEHLELARSLDTKLASR